MSYADQSIIIKDVYKLNIRKEIAEQAENLINQVEYPVLFWVNAETDKNYAALHPHNRNQFWITVKSDTVQSEVERIVLANLYKQVQLRKRYMVVMPNKNYLSKLVSTNDIKAQERLRELQNKVNAFTSSLECEMYLAQYRILTERNVRETGFLDRKQKLEDYLEMKRKQPAFRWYREGEVQNLIDYGFYARFEQRYEYHLTKLIKKIKPRVVSEHYLKDIQWVKSMIAEVYSRYTEDNGEDVINWMRKALVEYFHLESMLCVEAVDSRHARKMIYNRYVDIYTFVPEEYPQEELVLQSCRSVNECLGLFREKVFLDTHYPFASVAVSYDTGRNISSFVSSEKEYYILLYVDFLSELEQIVRQYRLNGMVSEIQSAKGDAYVRQKLMKYALFFITLHEYAHILHGDCDHLEQNEPVLYRIKKEDLADKFANENFSQIINYQYRLLSQREFFEYTMEDMVLQVEAKSIALSMRKL